MRYTPNRKMRIINSIRYDRITAEQARQEHGISKDELQEWMRKAEAHGTKGLRTTHTQDYREVQNV